MTRRTTRICLVVQGIYDSDPRVRRKAEALVSAGYSVDVLALRPTGGEEAYSIEGVQVRTVDLGKKRGSLLRYAVEYAVFFAWAFARLHVDTFRRRYAVIDVNTLPDFLIFAGLFTRWMGARLVLDMHEITPEFYLSKYGDQASPWMIRWLTAVERISYGFADRVITINEPVRELLVSRGLDGRKLIVMTNAADEKRFAPAAAAEIPPATASQSPRFVFIYHGTLTRIYGLDIAIEAFALAAEAIPGAEFWILGTGPERDSLARLALDHGVGDRVKFVGQVPSSTIPAWLSESDAGVLPIRRDALLDFAFPNKLPEYIISGRPVVISRLNAIQHYFTPDALAYAEPGDPEDLARQMRRVYADADLRRRLTATAMSEYAPIRWDVMKQRYLAMMAEQTSRAQEPWHALEGSSR